MGNACVGARDEREFYENPNKQSDDYSFRHRGAAGVVSRSDSENSFVAAVSLAATLPEAQRQETVDNPRTTSPESVSDIFHLTNSDQTPPQQSQQPDNESDKVEPEVVRSSQFSPAQLSSVSENNNVPIVVKTASVNSAIPVTATDTQHDQIMPWRQVLYKVADSELWPGDKREDRPQWKDYLKLAEKLVKAPRKDLPQEVVKQVLQGDAGDLDLSSLPSPQPKMIVFVSSTFTDTKAERNHLMRDVYPFLRKLCRNIGVDFGTVDMRWGVTEDATLDHSTVAMCVDEIKRCTSSSAGPAFLCILGQKYGYRPLPAQIEKGEFDKLTGHLTDTGQDTELLQAFYRLDTNELPPAYFLIPQPKGDTTWWDSLEKIQEQLRVASVACFGEVSETTDKYHISVTETEISNGVFKNKKSTEQVLFMERDLENLTSPEHLDRKLIDMKDAEIDRYAQERLSQLRQQKISGYSSENLVLKIDYENPQVSECQENVKQCCDNICARLADKILQGYEKNLHVKTDAIFNEALEHRKTMMEKCKLFVGRENQIKQITIYSEAVEHKKQILVLHGESGCGKTSLIAMAVEKTKATRPNAVVLVRFIGTTAQSGAVRPLLLSVCTQITRAYDKDVAEIPYSYKGLIKHFRTCLGYADESKPLVIFLDSLDQLSSEDFAHNLNWLSLNEELPEHVNIVVSTLPTKCLDVLVSFLPQEDMIKVDRLSVEEGPDILRKMLQEQGRSLLPEHEAIVLDKFKGCALPLFLRLAADIASTWHSYDEIEPDAVGNDITGLITQLFERLEARFGATFVRHALAYITAAKFGLSGAELEDILSCDDVVLDSIFQWWTPPFRRMPQLLWARVRSSLGNYLVERGTEGVSAYNWYHRQFWQTAEDRYLYQAFGDSKEPFLNQAHEAVADYFEGKWAKGKLYPDPNSTQSKTTSPKLEDRNVPEQPLAFLGKQVSEVGRQINGRKLSEQPYHLIKLKDWSRFKALVTSLEYIEAKFENDDGYDCLGELIAATGESGDPHIQMLTRFVGSNLSFLLREPQAVYQLAVQQSNTHPVRQLLESQPDRIIPMPLLRNMFDESFHDPCEMTLQGHTATVRCCDYSPKEERIVSTGDDGSLRVWDAITGAELVTISSLPAPVWPGKDERITLMIHPVNPCCFSHSGDVIANGTEHGDVMLWDVSGAQLQMSHSVDNPITFVQFSPDDTIIATSFKNGNVMIWDASTLSHLTTVRVGSETTGLHFSPDGKVMAVASLAGVAFVDTSTYSISGMGSSAANLILCCCVHPDGKQVMTGGDDSCVGVWDIASAKQIDSLRRHKAWIWSIKFTKDGRHMFTCSSDRCMKVWRFDGSWEVTATIGGHSHRVSMVSIKPGTEDKLVTSSLDQSLKLWDMASILEGAVPPVGGLHFNVCVYSQVGHLVTSQGWQKTSNVANILTHEDHGATPEHTGFITKAEFIQNGTRLVQLDTGHGGDYGAGAAKKATVKVIQIPEMTTLSHNLGAPGPTCINCDSDSIAVGTLDGDVYMYDSTTLEERDHWSWGHRVGCIAKATQLKLVVVCSGKTSRVFDTGSGNSVLVDLPVQDSIIYNCEFSPDNSFLATGLESGKICIWNTSDRSFTKRQVLTQHTAYIKNIKFGPHGRYMLTCGDLSLRVWDIKDNLSLKCAFYAPVNCADFKTETVVLAGEATGNMKTLDFNPGKKGGGEGWKHESIQVGAEEDELLTEAVVKIKPIKEEKMRSRARILHDD